MKYRFVWKTTVFLVMFAFLCGASAEMIRTTGDVNLRSGPGLNYGILGSLSLGTEATYLNVSKIDDRGVTWYKVNIGNIDGWVSSRYSIIASGSSAPSGFNGSGTVVTTGDVNIRSGPGLTYDTLSSIGAGTTISYLGKTEIDDRGVSWFEVTYSGVSGWVSSKYAYLNGGLSSGQESTDNPPSNSDTPHGGDGQSLSSPSGKQSDDIGSTSDESTSSGSGTVIQAEGHRWLE